MRRCLLLIALVALVLGARPQGTAACSILLVSPDQRASVVQDTTDRVKIIVRGKVVGVGPIAVDGRYYQQLTLNVTTSWRGRSVAQTTVVGVSLSSDTSLATTIGVFTGTGPQIPCGGAQHRVGNDLIVFATDAGRGNCVSQPTPHRAIPLRRPPACSSARVLRRRPRHRCSRPSSPCSSARSPGWRSSGCAISARAGSVVTGRGAVAVAVARR